MNLNKIIEDVCKYIAPAWPFQSFVGVNPFWHKIDENFFSTLSYSGKISGNPLLMPLSFYIDKKANGLITNDDIEYALNVVKNETIRMNRAQFLRESFEAQEKKFEFQIFSDFFNQHKTFNLKQFIVEEITKYCSSYFDLGQSAFNLANSNKNLFHVWREMIEIDRTYNGIDVKIDPTYIKTLPKNVSETIQTCLVELGVSDDVTLKNYLLKILFCINGWASYIKYQLWQTDRGFTSYDINGTGIEDLFAIYLSYECIFKKSNFNHNWQKFLSEEKSIFDEITHDHLDHLKMIWQIAYEHAYQKNVSHMLCSHGFLKNIESSEKDAQVVFCIDVRSEVIRRALEQANPNISTHGFAGFFGIPIQCEHPIHGKNTYRLPVLLKPKILVQEDLQKQYGKKLFGKKSLESFLNGLKNGLSSSFLFVELFGSLFSLKLLKTMQENRYMFEKKLKEKFFKPSKLKNTLTLEDKIDLAIFILKHLGIKKFANYVFICGHGSLTTNNLYESSLDCGACGGHSGELNVKLLCEILNDLNVRTHVNKSSHFCIPHTTTFIPSIHETVSDQIYILEKVNREITNDLKFKKICNSFKIASDLAQKERSSRLSSYSIDPIKRATAWSEVRPEWGLVNNASFIIAPRERTQAINLEGRSFLHDYDYSQDKNFETLELILTAPMLVTNWINMQYYASSVGMKNFSSGNKTLQNAVGLFGVIEGNCSDLKTGLPIQSIHDGQRLIHEPLRLSVFVDAPSKEIEAIINKHDVLKNLIQNQWLHLFCIDREAQDIKYRYSNEMYLKW